MKHGVYYAHLTKEKLPLSRKFRNVSVEKAIFSMGLNGFERWRGKKWNFKVERIFTQMEVQKRVSHVQGMTVDSVWLDHRDLNTEWKGEFLWKLWIRVSPVLLLPNPSSYCLLTVQQTNKSRDMVLGQGVETLSEKPANGEDGGLLSQRIIFPELEFRLLSY